MLKVMLLVMDEQRVILDRLYESIQGNLESCEIFRLSSAQQKNLGGFLSTVNYQDYDRVVIFTRVKRQLSQLKVLQCVAGLVFLEHDACQNYMPNSKYFGVYSRLYKRLPWVRVISSGFSVAQKLRDEGVDAVYVSKGYDEALLKDVGDVRDVCLAFFGSLNSPEYSGRKKILDEIAARTDMLISKTDSGAAYLTALNRVQIFVSADVGMGEYMIKNFEAMACGCTLLTLSQGAIEDAAVGFRDMENVVLYKTVDEAIEKIAFLKENPRVARRIAVNGKTFVEINYNFSRVGREVARALEVELRPRPKVGWPLRYWMKFRHNMKVSCT